FLLVQGVQRFTLKRVLKERPFFEAEVILHEEKGKLFVWFRIPQDANDLALEAPARDAQTVELFQQLRQLSRELLALLRLSSLVPTTPPRLSAIVARRLELYVSMTDVVHAGRLADFMAAVSDASLEEKLQSLASFNLKDRLEIV